MSWFRQKKIFAYQSCSKGTFFIWTKFRLKNRVTAVHLLQFKTNFFIHILFCGTNLLQIKEYPSLEASINTQFFYKQHFYKQR